MSIATFKSWENDITIPDVSIALEHLLIAPVGTVWTPSRVDVSSPPAGFIHLGAVQEDSPQVSAQKQIYRLETGIPRVLRYQSVTGMQGTMQLVFHSMRNTHVYMSLGGIPPYHAANTPTGGWATVHSVVGRDNVIVNSIATVSSITAGALVVTDTSLNISTTLNEAYVTSITALAGNSLYSVYLAGPDGFPALPVQSNPFFSIAHDVYAAGTNNIPFFTALGVADFLGGAQVVHFFNKLTPRGEFTEALRNGQDMRVPASFDIFGYSAASPHASANQLMLFQRYLFAPTSIGL